jgi:phage terminase small subunit
VSTPKLTPKQERFAAEYVKLGNAAEAYRLAYNAKHMKAETVHKRASELLADGEVAGRVAEIRAKAQARTEITIDRVLREVARLAFSDHRALFRENGSLKAPHEIDGDTAATVASVEVFEEFEGRGKNRVLVGYTKKMKLWDKNAALEKLMRHLGAFDKDNRQKSNPLADFMREFGMKQPGLHALVKPQEPAAPAPDQSKGEER